MSLALLEAEGSDGAYAGFLVDTGTSRFFELRLGRSVRRVEGIDVLDDLVHTTPVGENPAAGEPFAPRVRVAVPIPTFDGRRVLAQLVTFRSRTGRSPAFSQVLDVETAPTSDRWSSEMVSTMTRSPTSAPPGRSDVRHVRCRTGAEAFAEQASVGDVLAQLADLAEPLVSAFLASQRASAVAATAGGTTPGVRSVTPPPGTSPGGGGSAAAASPGAGAIAAVIDAVLMALAGSASPARSLAHSIAATASSSSPTVVRAAVTGAAQNRFAQPFIFGIDDALLGMLASSVAGPLIQALPQLANLLNQRRLGTIQAHNQHNAALLGELNRRILLERIAEARQSAASDPSDGGTAAGLDQLAALLQAAAPTPAAGLGPTAPAPAAPVVVPASLATSVPAGNGSAPRPAGRAVLEVVTAPPIVWNGVPTVLFSKTGPVRLRVRLTVGAPVPAAPLPRAIMRLVIKDARTHADIAEQSTRLEQVAANSVVTVDLDPLQLARIPLGRPVSLLAELRWSTGRGSVAALGSLEAVFIAERFLRREGPGIGAEHDLADMARFRSFWNKVWESPAGGGGHKLWDLDVAAKFAVLVSPDHDTNGAMEPRLQRSEQAGQGVTERVAGRLKAGIEVAIAELATLRSLWPDEPPLPAGVLEALRTERFARDRSGEVVTSLRLRGRTRERGLVWAVPTVQLAALTLATVTAVDDAGQVTAAVDEVVRFPVPTGVRFVGLLGTAATDDVTDDGGGAAGDDTAGPEEPVTAGHDGSSFSFEGYETVFAHKVSLTPVASATPGRS